MKTHLLLLSASTLFAAEKPNIIRIMEDDEVNLPPALSVSILPVLLGPAKKPVIPGTFPQERRGSHHQKRWSTEEETEK